MQIQVETLRHALALLEPVVPKKPPLPACQHVLVGEGRAVANDLEIAVMLEVPEAEGPPLCFPRQALGFLERVPGGIMATIEPVDGNLAIAAGPQRASFKTVDADDFPPMPALDPEHEGVIEGDSLIRDLHAVAPYAATEDSRPVLTAICLALGDSPRLVTADGFRLAWEDLPGRLSGEGNLLIPQDVIRPLAHLWKASRGSAEGPHGHGLASLALVQRFIRLGWRDQRLRLNWGTVTMLVELQSGTFPSYGQLIPKDFSSHVTVLAEDLYRALGAVDTLARDGSGIVRLEWAGSTLKVTARGEDDQSTEVEIPAACDPADQAGRIAFNIGYLLQYLKGKQGMVKLSVSTPSSPGLLTYHGRGNHVIMPMFVQWATYPPEPAPEADTSGAATAEADLPFGPVHVGETGDPDGPKDDPVFSEETPVEDTEADMTPAPSDQPPTRAEAAKPRRKAKAQAGA